MSSALDSYVQETVTVFEGQVKDITYYQTSKGDQYVLVSVRNVEKPLAIPVSRKFEIPTMGDHVSVECNEGSAWYFPTHRAIVVIKKPDFAVWSKPSTIDLPRRQQAEQIIIEYATKNGSVSADDVCNEICMLFPERDTRIVGGIFLGLSKRGIIHRFGEKRTERKNGHGSPLPMWHLTK